MSNVPDEREKEKLTEQEKDIEALISLPASPTTSQASADSIEYHVSTTTKFSYLTVYFLCNVLLTLYNKAILGKFTYPWLLTAIHAGAASIGCSLLLLRGSFTLSHLSLRQEMVLLGFSLLFTVNIAVSNVSLALVSIPFHQIMRSTCPVFTVLIYRACFNRTYSFNTYLSLIPVVAGVALATYGDYEFTPVGFYLTLLGVVLASIKTVATNRIMTGPLRLSPLESLLRMSPLACIQALICSYLSGELTEVYQSEPFVLSKPMMLALAGNGLIAFLLNVSSFSTNKYTGALTMTVCGNVKQSLTVLLGIALFGVNVGAANGLGMGVALAGAAWYSVVELHTKTMGNGIWKK